MSTKTEKHTCCARVWSGYILSHACGRTANYEHEGRHYCKTHHPPTVAEKNEAKRLAWNRKWDADRARREQQEREQAEQRRRAECFPELLEALQEMVAMCATFDEDADRQIAAFEAAEKAIFKALGEQQ